MLQKTTKLLLTTIAAIATINTLEVSQIPNTSNNWLTVQTEAQARSSGGRSGGGSFKQKSSGSSSNSSSKNSSSSSGSRSNRRSSNRSRSYNNSPSYNNNNSRNYSSSGTSSDNGGGKIFLGVIFAGISGIIIFAIVSSMLKSALSGNNNDHHSTAYNKERDNNIVTISELQIALLALATDVQSGLTELSLRVDTSTEEGLKELLQESILILLRNSEYWTHHIHRSEKINIEQAESKFNRLSLEQRSKLSVETLSNIEGNIKQKTVTSPDDESAMYIVVTLLVGTAHDKPLFQEIRTPDDLKEALNTLGSMPSDYLLKFELIWSPQTEKDSLTYDEFITEYTNMVQLL
ncbi:MAG: DUF1517 domain-containing protein [Crocosphaera sp.]